MKISAFAVAIGFFLFALLAGFITNSLTGAPVGTSMDHAMIYIVAGWVAGDGLGGSK